MCVSVCVCVGGGGLVLVMSEEVQYRGSVLRKYTDKVT